VLVVALIPVLSIAGWRAIRDSKAARDVTSTAQSIPVTPTALLGGVDANGQLTTLAMLALDPDGVGGNIVSVPVGASVTGDDGTRHRLADSYASGGVDALKADVESMMLVTLDVAQVADEAQLAALLAPVGAVSVDLPGEVLEGGSVPASAATTAPAEASTTTQPRRSTTSTSTTSTTTTVPPNVVVAPAGAQQLDGAGLANVLLASVPGQSEIDRLPTNLAVWNAVAATVGAGIAGATPVDVSAGGPSDLTAFTTNLWAGKVGVWQLGASLISSATDNPTGADLLQVDLAESIMVVATVAPSAVSAVLDGASIQLTTGFSDWHITREAVAVLVYIGANVMVVINTTEPPPAQTEVFAASVSVQAFAEAYSKALAGGAVEAVQNPVEGIEVQIVLGQSFADAQAASGPSATLASVPSSDTDVDANIDTTPTSTTVAA
jgi:hypothetical protein